MLELKNVSCGYDKEIIVNNISFSVKRGEMLSIIGPNGCGKSTLLKSIDNLIDYSGSISLDSVEINSLSRKELALKVALMTQANNIHFPYSVFDTVALGRYAHLNGVFSTITEKDEEIVLNSIKSVGLLEIKDKLISELSGGQLQRVYLARAFAQNPDLILLDEPTNHLDLKCQIDLLEHLIRWTKENNKISICVLHDLNLVQKYSENVIIMNKGTLVEKGKPYDVLRKEKVKEIYGIDVKSFMIDALKKWI